MVLSDAATVQVGTSFLLVGGEEHPNPGVATTAVPTSTMGTPLDTIYEYDPDTMAWITRVETLTYARSGHVAVLLQEL